MTLNDAVIANMDNEPLTSAGRPLTLFGAMVDALLAPSCDKGASGTDKMRRFLLAERIHKAAGLVDLTVDEAKEIKNCVGIVFAAVVVGPVYRALDSGA